MGVDKRLVLLRYGSLLQGFQREQRHAQRIAKQKASTRQEPLPESVLGLFDYCPLALIDPNYAEPGDPVFDERFVRQLGIGYDIKHNRITFPLRNHKGELIGISGRSTAGQWPRYKVYSAEYEAYGLPRRDNPPKGSILWNYDKTYPNICAGSEAPLVVVEGFKACLSVLSVGAHCVALLGSHMTEAQQRLLEHIGSPLYLMLDNDLAGRQGMEKIAPILATKCIVKVVEYDGRQPTDLSGDNILGAIYNAPNYYTWKVEKVKSWHTEKTQAHSRTGHFDKRPSITKPPSQSLGEVPMVHDGLMRTDRAKTSPMRCN